MLWQQEVNLRVYWRVYWRVEAGHLWLVDQPRDVVILGPSLFHPVGVMRGGGCPLAVPYSDLRLETVAFGCSAS